MKRHLTRIPCVVLFVFFITVSAYARDPVTEGDKGNPALRPAEGISPTRGTFGIGFVLGEPTGVSWKYWLDGRRAVDGAFGYSFGDDYRISVNYLLHENAFEDSNFPLYYGIGGAISGNRGYISRSREGDFALGVRGVIGVSYLFKKAPLDAFLEVAPIVFIAPPLGLSIDFAFGLRVYP